MIRYIKNVSEVSITIADLGLLLEAGQELELTDNFELSTINASGDLKELIINNSITLNNCYGVEAINILSMNVMSMINGIELTWQEFKAFIGAKENVAIYIELTSYYHLFAPGYPYFTFIKKATNDALDFETNYKTWCDKVKTIRGDGRTRIHATACPEDQHPMFVGCGDGLNSSTGKLDRDLTGEELLYEFDTTSGLIISKDILFADDILVEDGTIMYENAPLGASVYVEIIHPTVYPTGHPMAFLNGAAVRRFVKRSFIFGTNYVGQIFDTDAPGKMSKGLILRISICNPDNRPIAQNWKACGNLKIYRLFTTNVEEIIG